MMTNTTPNPSDIERIVMRQAEGPLPVIDRIISQTGAGSRLTKLIEQVGSTMALSEYKRRPTTQFRSPRRSWRST